MQKKLARNVMKAARYAAGATGRILVTFPFNDYLIAGKCATCEPKKHCAVHADKAGLPFVRFDGQKWRIQAEVYQFKNNAGGLLRRDNGSLFRAHLSFAGISTFA